MQKSSSYVEMLHLPLVIYFPFFQCLTLIMNDNALIDDWCLLNTLLPNREQHLFKQIRARGNQCSRWVHVILDKYLNATHAALHLNRYVFDSTLWMGYKILIISRKSNHRKVCLESQQCGEDRGTSDAGSNQWSLTHVLSLWNTQAFSPLLMFPQEDICGTRHWNFISC